MLKYELCKKLKDAGFPQDFPNPLKETIYGFGDNGSIAMNRFLKFEENEVENRVHIPTLSELIEACGDRFAVLYIEYGVWTARVDEPCNECASDYYLTGEGNTPEEAVANLYLKLND